MLVNMCKCRFGLFYDSQNLGRGRVPILVLWTCLFEADDEPMVEAVVQLMHFKTCMLLLCNYDACNNTTSKSIFAFPTTKSGPCSYCSFNCFLTFKAIWKHVETIRKFVLVLVKCSDLLTVKRLWPRRIARQETFCIITCQTNHIFCN